MKLQTNIQTVTYKNSLQKRVNLLNSILITCIAYSKYTCGLGYKWFGISDFFLCVADERRIKLSYESNAASKASALTTMTSLSCDMEIESIENDILLLMSLLSFSSSQARTRDEYSDYDMKDVKTFSLKKRKSEGLCVESPTKKAR